jgi:hypothetical protein
MSNKGSELSKLVPAKKAAKSKLKRTMDVTNVAEAVEKIDDLEVFGNGDLWVLLCKAGSKSEGWFKSTKAMELPHGCLVQVSTLQDGNVAEAITFVDKVVIGERGGQPALVSYVERLNA